jgi:hydrogenase maturation factor HypF (carbamoyltransferase family)
MLKELSSAAQGQDKLKVQTSCVGSDLQCRCDLGVHIDCALSQHIGDLGRAEGVTVSYPPIRPLQAI